MVEETLKVQNGISRDHYVHWGCIFAGLIAMITGGYTDAIERYDLNDHGWIPYLMFGWVIGIISVIGCTIYKLAVKKHYMNK
ncbi:MAG: hypothetical protein MPK62_12195, partial [Alphaproteobacteria bacterium]|nr:hypothetical protein [Alphaproteobacteria bacterium]